MGPGGHGRELGALDAVGLIGEPEAQAREERAGAEEDEDGEGHVIEDSPAPARIPARRSRDGDPAARGAARAAGGPGARPGPPGGGQRLFLACARRLARRTLSFLSIRFVDIRTSAAGSLSPPMKVLAGLATMNA